MSRHRFSTLLALIAVVAAALALTTGGLAAAADTDVKINEVESNGDTSDWVEVYNTGSGPVDISGWVLSDNSVETFSVPSGTVVAAGGFYVIDGLPFGLGSGDTAELFLPGGVTLIDTYTWPTGHAPITYGLCPDGQGAMQQTSASTKGSANVCTPPPTTTIPSGPTTTLPANITDVRINEFDSNPTDWIELLNTGTASVDISGWYLMDDQARTDQVPPGTVLAAGGYYVHTPTFGLGNGDQVRVFANDGTTLVDSHTYAAHPIVTFGRCPNGTGPFTQNIAATMGAENDCGTTPTTTTNPIEVTGSVRITEVAPWSSGNSSLGADWFEVTNTGSSAMDITGWKTDDDSDSFALGALLTGVTSIAAGESVIFVESSGTPSATAAAFAAVWFPGGLPVGLQIGTYSGSGGLSTGGDRVNVFDAAGVQRARVSFGPSPSAPTFGSFDNTAGLNDVTIAAFSQVGVNSAFQVVDGVAVLIGSPGTATTGGSAVTTLPPTVTTPSGAPWPGGATISPVDLQTFAVENLSGLTYEGSGTSTPGAMWAVLNNPGTLHRLTFDGVNWVPSTTWTLKYPDGLGNPDAEGVTMAGFSSSSGIYVATERNNDAGGVSKSAILRFAPTGPGGTLNATHVWDVTADFAPTTGNTGLETITWVPDSFLVSKNFFDQHAGTVYDPAAYPDHGDGLFLVGVEATGMIYAYALDGAGTTFTRVAAFPSGFTGVMASEFDPDNGELWAHCDNGCQNRTNVLRVSGGAFTVIATVAAPVGMAVTQNVEGMAIAPSTECVAGFKPVYFTDDGDGATGATPGFSLYAGTVSCAPLVVAPPAEVPEFPTIVLGSLSALGVLFGFGRLTRRRVRVVPA